MNGSVVPRTKLDYLCMVLMNATIPALLVWRYLNADTSKSVAIASSVVSALIMNAAFLWGIKKRNSRRQASIPRHLLISCLLFAVGAVGATVAGVDRPASQDDLLRLAVSNTPLNEIRPEEKRLFVGFLRIRERNSRDNSRRVAEFKPMSPPLYSVDSFADLEVINRTAAAVRQIAEVDFSYAAQLQQTAQDFRDSMLRVDPRSDYLARGLALRN
jgi:hypothetical protein